MKIHPKSTSPNWPELVNSIVRLAGKPEVRMALSVLCDEAERTDPLSGVEYIRRMRDLGSIDSCIAGFLIGYIVDRVVLPGDECKTPEYTAINEQMEVMEAASDEDLSMTLIGEAPPEYEELRRELDNELDRIEKDIYEKIGEPELWKCMLGEALPGEDLYEQGRQKLLGNLPSAMPDVQSVKEVSIDKKRDDELSGAIAFARREESVLLALCAAVAAMLCFMRSLDHLASDKIDPKNPALPLDDMYNVADSIMNIGDLYESGRTPDSKQISEVSVFILCTWKGVVAWYPLQSAWSLLSVDNDASPPILVRAFERWLREGEPHLPDIALVAGAVSTVVAKKTKEFPLFDKRMHRVKIAVLDFLKKRQLTTWPAVIRAVDEAWNEYYLERLTDNTARAAVNLQERLKSTIQKAKEDIYRARADAETARKDAKYAAKKAALPSDKTKFQLESVQRELTQLRGQIDQLEQERSRLAQQHTRALTRAERAESRLQELENELAASARQLLEAKILNASDDSLSVIVRNENEIVSEEGSLSIADLPPDVFVGKRFLIFTGKPRGSERARIEQAFRDLGAEDVQVIDPHRSFGPQNYPSDAYVVLDGSFVGHKHCFPVRDRAARAGCWYLEGSYGATGIVRAVAERLGRS